MDTNISKKSYVRMRPVADKIRTMLKKQVKDGTVWEKDDSWLYDLVSHNGKMIMVAKHDKLKTTFIITRIPEYTVIDESFFNVLNDEGEEVQVFNDDQKEYIKHVFTEYVSFNEIVNTLLFKYNVDKYPFLNLEQELLANELG